jgi:hypothetical protein
MKCLACDGKGYVRVDFEGAPESAWLALPRESRLAYDMGMVEFTSKTCKKCEGRGAV